MAYTWPYAILLPWRGPCAYTPLSLSNMRATSVASAPPSTDFQIAISTIGPFLSRVSMFPHSLLLPSFWFIKPSLLPYFLFPKLCLFFKTSYYIVVSYFVYRHKKREGKVERDIARVFYTRLSPVLLKKFNSILRNKSHLHKSWYRTTHQPPTTIDCVNLYKTKWALSL